MQRPPSLEVVEDIVRHELDTHARRADATDTRAGLLLGVAGLLVSLGTDDGSPLFALVARVLAGAAGLLVILTLNAATQSGYGIDAENLARKYLDRDPLQTRLRVLEMRLTYVRLLHRRHLVRVARLRLASVLVMAAVAFAVTGASVEVVT